MSGMESTMTPAEIAAWTEMVRDGSLARYVKGGDAVPTTAGSITYAEAVEMRAEYAAGGITYAELGRRYGKSSESISQIVRGLHYPGPVEVTGSYEAELARRASEWEKRNA